jgi:hypothetical protein
MLVQQFKRAAALLALALLASVSAIAQNAPALPAGVTRVASVEGITE